MTELMAYLLIGILFELIIINYELLILLMKRGEKTW